MIKSLLSGIEHSALQLGEVARRLSCSRRFLEKQVAAERLRVVRPSPRCVRIRPTNFPLIKSSFDFQSRFPSKSKPITAMLSTGPSLNLHKARFSCPAPLSQPTLKIKQAHSLATAKLRASQSALLIQPYKSRLLLLAPQCS